MSDLRRFTKGAQLERWLRVLKPGDRFTVPLEVWREIEVPANPLDRQTPAYLAEWFRSRMPFRCEAWENMMTGAWEFRRVPWDEPE